MHSERGPTNQSTWYSCPIVFKRNNNIHHNWSSCIYLCQFFTSKEIRTVNDKEYDSHMRIVDKGKHFTSEIS